MLTVVFILRAPGSHRENARKMLPVVPRKDELVFVVDDMTGHYVHDVVYLLHGDEPKAHVLLR